MTDPKAFLDFGWIGLLIWLLAEKFLPIVRDWVMPNRAEERRADNERKAKLEERTVLALEKIAELAYSQNVKMDSVSEKVDHVKGDTTVIRDNSTEILAILNAPLTRPVKRSGSFQ